MRLPAWRDWPLSVKVTALMILLATLPLLAITLYNSSQARDELLAAARSASQQRAIGTATAIDAYLDERLRDIQTLATLPILHDYLAGVDPQGSSLEQTLDQIRAHHGFRSIYVLDVEGQVVASTDPRLIGQDNITSIEYRMAAAGRVYAGEPYLHKGESFPTLQFAAPVRTADGLLLGIVILNDAAIIIDGLVTHDTGFAGPGGYGMLWDSDGLILVHGRRLEVRFTSLAPPPDPAAGQATGHNPGEHTGMEADAFGDNGAIMERSRTLLYDRGADPFLRLRAPDGKWQHAVIVPLAEKRWLYGIFVPESNLLARVGVESRNSLVAAGLAAIGASVVSLLLARQIGNPVRAVADAARAIAAGQLGQRIGLRSKDEVGQLASAFDEMATALQRRTSELQAAHDKLSLSNKQLQQEIKDRTEAQEALRRAHSELERRVSERTAALRESEERYRAVFEQAADSIVLIDAETGALAEFNDSAHENLGYTREEFQKLKIADFEVVESAKEVAKRTEEIIREGGDTYETKHRTKSGEMRDVLVTVRGIFLQGKDYLLGIWRDITERKQTYAALQESTGRLQQLSQQVVIAQEEERRRIGHELHDAAGQALTLLKINLDLIQSDLQEQPSPLRQKFQVAADLVDDAFDQIRLLAHDLVPPALDTLGLELALENYCRDFADRTPLEIIYSGSELPSLNDAQAICLYRFLQEALTNIIRHAEAEHVRVKLSCSNGTISLEVEDDGHGIRNLDQLFDDGRIEGIGLLGMHDRLEVLGGKLEIESRIGQGARLVACIDFDKETKET